MEEICSKGGLDSCLRLSVCGWVGGWQIEGGSQEGEREGEKERERERLFASHMRPIKDQIHDLGMCPVLQLNPPSFSIWEDTPSTEPPSRKEWIFKPRKSVSGAWELCQWEYHHSGPISNLNQLMVSLYIFSSFLKKL